MFSTALPKGADVLKATLRKNLPRDVMWRLARVRLAYAGADAPNANFGDQLSPLLVSQLFGLTIKHSGINAADLVAVGSLLEGVEDLAQERPFIWGSGFIRPGQDWRGGPVRVRAVRGMLSYERLSSQVRGPVALGDPGLLVDRALRGGVSRSTSSSVVGLIPHFTELDSARVMTLRQAHGVEVISPLAPVETVVSRIAACRLVMSSSLHGLIVADSLGVPNAWMEPSESVDGGRYKFDDYYSAFGVRREPRDPNAILADVDRAVAEWSPLPRIESIKDGLVRAFPLVLRRKS
ncbi:polysaccharide pyruvyl transferase family protein [Acidipropionibacterium timonense]|uniref:polysaccharide pyruvyl transferase family protein n=1 Tax=Acidipropionibacterium timonense TaxID=2161818 RepID=UPI0010303AB6|nr:polysaccharide pyruvyl transferase family protein [Acidipropionibacterium timonense]